MTEVTIRSGRPQDSATIAQLYLIASDGLVEYVWSLIAEPGESAIEAGIRGYAREGDTFSYQNCILAELGGTVVGMAHGFPMDADPPAELAEDPVLRPYMELQDHGSLYLSGIALFPDHRNRGIGSRLMAAIEDQARALALPRVSLICFERNESGMRFYRRLGFAEIDRRAIVPHPMLHVTDGDAVLLARAVPT